MLKRCRRNRYVFLIGLASLIAAGLVGYRYFVEPREAAPQPEMACLHRAYLLDDGRLIWFGNSSFTNQLRYYLMSGETGVLQSANATSQDGQRFTGNPGWKIAQPPSVEVIFKDAGDVVHWNAEGRSTAGKRVAAKIEETTFISRDTVLHGRLVMPDLDRPVPIAVMVHGSERLSAVWNHRLQFMFPANGIGVFVYDKRGTGRSEGKYTQDFHLLAEDAVTGMAEARRISEGRFSEIGYCGGSQAGWIIPLAAQSSSPDFLCIGYGLAEGPLAEDRDEVQTELRLAGYDDVVLAQAREVTDATARVIASGFKEGFDDVNSIHEKYSGEEWYSRIQGEFTGDILRYPGWLVRFVGPWYDLGTTWTYDPAPALESNTAPTLWILAGDDREAPCDNTLTILRALQRKQSQLDIALFPNADHSMIEYRGEGEERTAVRFSPGYFDILVEWIKTKKLDQSFEGVQIWEE